MASTTPDSAAHGRPRMRSSDIVIDDERLSLAAKGVFVTVTLLGAGCHIEELARHCRDQAGKIEAAVQELVRLRYVRLDGSAIYFEDAPRFGIPEA
ncbi:MAG TPA: hypothetical protein VKB31_06335 [Trueperaceae bacterium]|nr:hypothetical protein [Trueperaceae bacterium]